MKNPLIISMVVLLFIAPVLSIAQDPPAKPPAKPSGFQLLNTAKSLSMASLKGHVVLLYFWTYSNINSIHALDDMEALMRTFNEKPFQVVAVHSPKFYNERDGDNVKAAIIRHGITFPVIVDKGHALWKKYGVRAWPTYVLIGSGGKLLGSMAGERRLKLLEPMIKQALKRGKKGKTLAKEKYDSRPPLYPDSPLAFPAKLALDGENKRLYISDSGRHQVVEALLESPGRAKVLRRFGSGQKGLKDGDLNTACFSRPLGLAFYKGVLYVADSGNHAIRAVDLNGEKVDTIAGDGTYGQFGKPNSPSALAVHGNTLYIAMCGGHQLWTMALDPAQKKKELELYVGNGYENFIDGSALGSSLSQPSGFTVDAEGKQLFFADAAVSALRRVSFSDNSVKTLIGKGMFKYGFKDGKFAEAELQYPLAAAYHKGTVYVADTFNHALRAAELEKGEIFTLLWRSEDKKNLVNHGTKTGKLPLNEPGGLLVHGNLIYIADTNNHLIRVYDIEKRSLETLKFVE
jgi:sugar lactone lactonase YvrE/peroxiredoxin